jgi:rare lipoprotein A
MRRLRNIALLGSVLVSPCFGASAGDGNVGMASFYAGVPSSAGPLTAAHRELPLGTRVRVTRIDTGKTVVVHINDRGPFIKSRIIDVSRSAAEVLEMVGAGVMRVRVEVMEGAASQEVAIAPQTCKECELNWVESVD